MMTLFRRLRRHQRGAAALEFVLVAPALVLMIVGIARLGILFMANAGLGNAVAEGARYSTIWMANQNRRPSDAEIRTRILNSQFGLDSARFTSVTVTPCTSGSLNCVDIAASYAVPMDFIFFHAGSVNLTQNRRAFVRSPT